eukprot:gene3-12808_t
MKAADMGIHPRELSLFTTDNRLSQQRATITVRDNAILFKTEAARAIITADKAIVFKVKKGHDYSGVIAPILLAVDARSQLPFELCVLEAVDARSQLPFELCVLEVLLCMTNIYFDRRIAHLTWMLDRVFLHDFAKAAEPPFLNRRNENDVIKQAGCPLKRHDAEETASAINDLLEDDEALASICLTEARNLRASNNRDSSNSYRSVSFSLFLSLSQPIHPGVTALKSLKIGGVGAVKHLKLANAGMAAARRPPKAPPQGGGAARYPGGGGGGSGEGGGRSEYRMVHERGLVVVNSCPLPPPSAQHQAHQLLETYEREIESSSFSLVEMESHLDATRETWRMKLDNARNHFMLLNLYLTMASVSFMLTTLLPAFYGMNIEHGMEADQTYFNTILIGSIAAGLASFPAAFHWYRRHWMKTSSTELGKVSMLRLLVVQHMDHLDDILMACRRIRGKVDEKTFCAQVRRNLSSINISLDEALLKFLFRQFDANKDGFFEAAEIMRRTTRALDVLGRVPSKKGEGPSHFNELHKGDEGSRPRW